MTSANVPAEMLPFTWQLAAAFGQGAGTRLITSEAAAAVMEHYGEPLRRNAPTDVGMLQLIEFMRALGASAAAHALRRASAVIEPEDITHAVGRMARQQARPLGDCPICLQ